MKWLAIIFFFGLSFFTSAQNGRFTNLDSAMNHPLEVTELVLKRKKMVDFPMGIFQFSNLEKLDLSKNKITQIPREIAQLKNLKELKMYRNKIHTVPDEITQVDLEYVDLSDNKFTTFPDDLGNWKNIAYLDLERTDIETLSNSIQECEKLRFINLRDTGVDANREKELRKILPEDCIKLFPPRCNCD